MKTSWRVYVVCAVLVFVVCAIGIYVARGMDAVDGGTDAVQQVMP